MSAGPRAPGAARAADGAALRIAILAKAPLPGLAKTRLAPVLGTAGAAALAERLLRHAVAQAAAAAPGGVTLWAAPDTTHPVFTQLRQAHGVALAVQPAGDLGARMARVFNDSWAAAPGPLLLMGADIPALGSALLRQAADKLRSHAAVFVPAFDGGYALVGLRAGAPGLLAALFEGMHWSTPRVMADTRERLAQLGVTAAELAPVPDIDEAADLAWLPPGWLPAP